MDTYTQVIDTLKSNQLIQDNYECKNENLIIKLSNMIEVILHQEGNSLDMYINNYHFGDVSKNNIILLFQELRKENKVFIEYRRPKGIYNKEYFKIMNLDEFNKKKRNLIKRRGTKIYNHHKCIIDLY